MYVAFSVPVTSKYQIKAPANVIYKFLLNIFIVFYKNLPPFDLAKRPLEFIQGVTKLFKITVKCVAIY